MYIFERLMKIEKSLNKEYTGFGKKPILTFSGKNLIIHNKSFFGKEERQIIPIKDINEIRFEPFHLGKFILSLVLMIFLLSMPQTRSYLEIKYDLDGEEASLHCGGWFTDQEIEEMRGLIRSKRP